MTTRLYLVASASAAAGCIIGSLLMAQTSPENQAETTSAPHLPLQMTTSQPVELGHIRWERDWDTAVERSRETGRPLLVLFDEVPGCHTCTSYGEDVLSHPLIIDAAEALFIPVAVYNNVEGPDRTILRSFKEPEWNNPVVRIVDADRRPLAPRLNGDYTAAGLAANMADALDDPPGYLALLASGHAARHASTEHATFAMHCFWEGEAHLGALDGVTRTSVGFLDGNEVVEVEYLPSRISFDELARHAIRMECAHRIYTRTDEQHAHAAAAVGDRAVRTDEPIRRSQQDELYRLRHSTWRCVPMTFLQAARVNAAISTGDDPAKWMSPRQVELQKAIRLHRDAAWDEQAAGDDERLIKAWAEALARAARESP